MARDAREALTAHRTDHHRRRRTITTTTLTPDRAREQLAALDAARDRLGIGADSDDQGALNVPSQLSFKTGQRGEPDYASVKISGSVSVHQDLMKRHGFMVTVATMDGEVLVSRQAACTNVAFPDKTDKDGNTTTERVHTLTFE